MSEMRLLLTVGFSRRFYAMRVMSTLSSGFGQAHELTPGLGERHAAEQAELPP